MPLSVIPWRATVIVSLFFCLFMLLHSQVVSNKAGYTAQDAPDTRLKITGDGRTDGRTDTTSYRDATAHLKIFLSREDASVRSSFS